MLILLRLIPNRSKTDGWQLTRPTVPKHQIWGTLGGVFFLQIAPIIIFFNI